MSCRCDMSATCPRHMQLSSAMTDEYSDRTAAAVIRRMAEGTPSGRNFVLSSGSFSRATRFRLLAHLIYKSSVSP
eukprot:scaffold180776_cov36-Cyclotella_meneghiniana.AAC.2